MIKSNDMNSKVPDIYMQWGDIKSSIVAQDSGLENIIEYVDKKEEYPTTARPQIIKPIVVKNFITKKRGRGRPPKLYDTLFQCDMCCFNTAYANKFRKHMSEAHQEEQARIFKCPHCTEAYVEERFLREHINHIHECIPRKPKLICAECGKGFPKESHLRRHSYVHNPDEKPFMCEYCPMRFPSQSSLTRHNDGTHNENKRHECEVCGKNFGHIYGLKAHKINVHRRKDTKEQL